MGESRLRGRGIKSKRVLNPNPAKSFSFLDTSCHFGQITKQLHNKGICTESMVGFN